MRKAIPLLLIPILLMSGCTSFGGAGVVIESFEPDFHEVFPGETISFSVKIRNTGTVKAENVFVKILGLDDWIGDLEECVVERDLLEATSSTPGESHICKFIVTAPNAPQGISVTYTPAARVTYTYSSSTLKSINIGSQQELLRIQNQGIALPSETISTTSSPILLEVTTQGPLRIYDTSLTFPLEIYIQNIGGGIPCTGDCVSNANWNRIEIQTDVGEEAKITSFNNIVTCSREVTLFRGQSNTLTCKMSLDPPEKGILQKIIRVDSKYNYFYDATTTVVVKPIQ